jgi:Mrp family chromosome partitioning ATPase
MEVATYPKLLKRLRITNIPTATITVPKSKGMAILVYYPQNKKELRDLIRLSKVKVALDFNKYKFSLPKKRWKVIFVTSGSENVGKSPSSVSKRLSAPRRGLTIVEGLWLYIAHPEILKKHAIDILGSKYGGECVPTLFQWKNHVYLSAICPDVRDKMCGAPVVLGEVEVPT